MSIHRLISIVSFVCFRYLWIFVVLTGSQEGRNIIPFPGLETCHLWTVLIACPSVPSTSSHQTPRSIQCWELVLQSSLTYWGSRLVALTLSYLTNQSSCHVLSRHWRLKSKQSYLCQQQSLPIYLLRVLLKPMLLIKKELFLVIYF